MKTKQQNLGFLLADVVRLMRRSFSHQMGDSPITLNEARALAYIGRDHGLRQIDLAEMLEIQPIQVARLIDKLAHLKLVERLPVPGDRRAYHIHLLPAAGEVLASFEKLANVMRQEAMAGLSSEQLDMMLAGLTHIRNNLNQR